MNRNILYVIIALLAVAVAIFAYQSYTESQQSGVNINVDEGGLSITATE